MILPPAGNDLLGGWTVGYRDQDDYPPSSANSIMRQVVLERGFPHQSRKSAPPSAPESSLFAKLISFPYLDAFLESGICKAWEKFVEGSELNKKRSREVERSL